MKILINELPTLEEIDDSQPVVLTIGNFDGLHLGHMSLLRKMKAIAQKSAALCVVMTFINHPTEFFRPLNPVYRLMSFQQKSDLLQKCGVDALLLQTFDAEFANRTVEEFFTHLLQHMNVAHIVLGHDAVLGRGRHGTPAEVRRVGEKLGIEIHYLAPVLIDGAAVSSSSIRHYVESGDFESVEKLLGRSYSLGIESQGEKFFTLYNVQQSLPPNGIYATIFQCKETDMMTVVRVINDSSRRVIVELPVPYIGHGEIAFFEPCRQVLQPAFLSIAIEDNYA